MSAPSIALRLVTGSGVIRAGGVTATVVLAALTLSLAARARDRSVPRAGAHPATSRKRVIGALGLALTTAMLVLASSAHADAGLAVSTSAPNILGARGVIVRLDFKGMMPPTDTGPHGRYAYQLWVDVAQPPAGDGSHCTAADLDPGPTQTHDLSSRPGAAFDVHATYNARTLGTYRICAWLVSIDPETNEQVARVTTPGRFTARVPHLALHISAPGRTRVGSPFTITVTTRSDGAARLDVLLWPPGGLVNGRCDYVAGGDIEPIRVIDSHDRANVKTRRTSPARRRLRLRQPGTYHVCAYLNSAFWAENGYYNKALRSTRAVVALPR